MEHRLWPCLGYTPRSVTSSNNIITLRVGVKLLNCCASNSTVDFCVLGKAPSQLFYSTSQALPKVFSRGFTCVPINKLTARVHIDWNYSTLYSAWPASVWTVTKEQWRIQLFGCKNNLRICPFLLNSSTPSDEVSFLWVWAITSNKAMQTVPVKAI